MKDRAVTEKLRRMVEKDLPDLEQLAIVRDGRDYLVFGAYRISPCSGWFRVTKHGVERPDFGSLRSALSWCIADKHNQCRLGSEIERLDAAKSLLQDDLAVREPLAKKVRDPGLRESVLLKLDTRRRRLVAVGQQLDKCINLAKYWQLRGFNNEIARTGRPQANRTHR